MYEKSKFSHVIVTSLTPYTGALHLPHFAASRTHRHSQTNGVKFKDIFRISQRWKIYRSDIWHVLLISTQHRRIPVHTLRGGGNTPYFLRTPRPLSLRNPHPKRGGQVLHRCRV